MVSSGKEYKGAAIQKVTKPQPKPSPLGQNDSNVLQDIKQMKRDETRKKQELYLHRKLVQLQEQEAKYTKFNRHKLQVKWREILRKVKVKDLQKDIEVMSHSHDREVDRKDALIQMLYRDIFEADEQYKIALRTHQQHIDELIRLHSRRMQSMEEVFQRNLRGLVESCNEEQATIEENHDEQMQEMRDVIKEMNKREEKKNEELEKEFAIESKAITSKYKNTFEVMRIQMDKTIKRKHAEYKDSNEEFGKPISQRYRNYEDLRVKNDKNEDKIRTQMSKIRKNEELLSQWKAKWLNNQREAEKRNNQLKEEIKVLKNHFNEAKKQMQAFQDGESQKLKNLVTMSKNTVDVLKNKLEHSERIVSLSLLNSKKETIAERELIDKLSEQQQLQNHPADVQNEMGENWQQLGNFYRKYNKVALDQVALAEEKNVLLARNNRLRSMLKAYLDGVSVNPTIMNKSNPLLIVEQMGGQVHNGVRS